MTGERTRTIERKARGGKERLTSLVHKERLTSVVTIIKRATSWTISISPHTTRSPCGPVVQTHTHTNITK